MQKKYFEVAAKCGHVGRDKYYEGHFFVKRNTASEAADVIRQVGRVKHDHPDAILWVREVTKEEYEIGREKHFGEAYFNCNSKREQQEHYAEIAQHIRPETHESKFAVRKTHETIKPVYDGKKKIRRPDSYRRFNARVDLDDFAEDIV